MDVTKMRQVLASLRKEHGMTQSELWERLGVTNKTVSRRETGTYMSPVKVLEGLSRLYGLTINEILCGRPLCGRISPTGRSQYQGYTSCQCIGVERKQAFFKKKWRKEHIATMVLAVAIWGGVLHNRLMAYTEDHTITRP